MSIGVILKTTFCLKEVSGLNRNITILIIILIIVLLAGYLVWLRNRFASTTEIPQATLQPSPTVTPTQTASPSATPVVETKEATKTSKTALPTSRTASPTPRATQ